MSKAKELMEKYEIDEADVDTKLVTAFMNISKKVSKMKSDDVEQLLSSLNQTGLRNLSGAIGAINLVSAFKK